MNSKSFLYFLIVAHFSLVLVSSFYFLITNNESLASVLGTSTEKFEIKASDDAHVKEENQDKNYGSDKEVYSDGDPVVLSLLKFNLKDYKDKEIESVKLKLTPTLSRKIEKKIKIATSSDWKESQVTWKNKPSLGATVGEIKASVSEGKSIEITLDKDDIKPYLGSELSLAIEDETGGYQLRFKSKEDGKPAELILSTTTEDEEETPNSTPTAKMTVDPKSGTAPLTAYFDGSSSTDSDGSIVSYKWAFGDGSSSQDQKGSHIYSTNGTFTLQLTVTDNKGATATKSQKIEVKKASTAPPEDTNQIPVASIVVDKSSGYIPLTVSFDGSGSKDTDGQITSYLWKFGNGVSASGAKAIYTYTTKGTYTAQLTVTDDKGATDTENVVIKADVVPPTTENKAPTAQIFVDKTSGVVPLTVNFNGSGSKDADGQIVSYLWDLGNGASSSLVSGSVTYSSAATYQIKLTVTDDKGAMAQSSVSVAATASTGGGGTTPPTGALPIGEILLSKADIAKLPMSGGAWEKMKSAADALTGNDSDLSNQDEDNDVNTLAAALVYAKYASANNNTVAAAYRAKAAKSIMKAVGTETGNGGGRTLALARNLAGYVLAADLIDLKSYNPTDESTFRTWLSAVRNKTLDGKSLISTHEIRPNNWGTLAGAARIAADIYLGDRADLDKAAKVYRAWVGDAGYTHNFDFADDMSWQCDPANPKGINPAGCTKDGVNLDGVLPDDQRRCGSFDRSNLCLTNYSWGALQGSMMQAYLLKRAGYTDSFEWGDKALLRASKWLYNVLHDIPVKDDTWQLPMLDKYYGTSYWDGFGVGVGKNVGWTDWWLSI